MPSSQSRGPSSGRGVGKPLCPACGEPMHAAYVPARTGYCIVLDQCVLCGGVWCDRWELYPLSPDAAGELDGADHESLLARCPSGRQPRRCPRCDIDLVPLSDPGLPPDAVIDRCAFCEGVWLNRGELGRIKQRDRRSPKPLAPGHPGGHGEPWPTVRQLDDATRQPTDTTSESLPNELLAGGVWIVGRLLLRWFLGF